MVTADPATVAAASRGPRRRTPSQGPRTRGWGLTALLALASLTVLVPLYFAVVMAFKTPEQAVAGTGFALPWPLNWASFADAWTLTGFPRAFAVSVLVSAVSVAGCLLLASWASYAIVRNWDRRLFRYSYFYLLAAMFIPFPVVALPQVKLTALLSLDNPAGVALLHVMFQLSFSVLLYSAFLRSIPLELEESARMDGASTWQVFWRVVFPLLAPMNATVGIFAFLASWNDFMMPSLITADQSLQTIPVVQKIFQLAFSTDYNVAFASYLMAMAPTIVVYVLAQRWVMSGVTRGAIK
ncbi:carbohydrate ABC transporter permease [Paenibacillus sp. TRM 82003]|uniref:carbohydrate ABC transporter permease n=1 Tax=Kineococcus sp. TRM81007 TaxID=2925831 RepID=UPI001F583375|nr:carbohydrate ABC transporter permease [Kineococcus sp. TRM81007]MCI2240123.1 carbohydrate ABC transporter permease [Kineococcus sp. TRM81007]MCI3925571.1 carbohydrate ABC transporter permease [Paenibacillus sp. TRM 82003]